MMQKRTVLLLAALLLISSIFIVYRISQKQRTQTTATNQSTLGHYLFFDTRLSFNNTKSCASCHAPQFAFTDGYRRSITATGDNVLHNAPTLINVAQHRYFDLADYNVTSLVQQHRRPLFNTHPVELGVTGNETLILERLQKDTLYQRLFHNNFPNETQPFTLNNIINALAGYVTTLQSMQSPFDKFLQGDSLAISADARKGLALFNNQFKCNGCHGGTYLTNATLSTHIDSIYFNTGLYNVGDNNVYPANDRGLYHISNKPSDDGRFKVPSLRNIALTAPYMHDGSVASLPEVIDIYARGGRNVTTGPNKGDGALNTYKSNGLKGFSINADERRQLLAFLYSLTDSTLFTNPVFQNPFGQANN